MTVLISNGEFLYADKWCSITGSANIQPQGHGYKIQINDVNKIARFRKDAFVNEHQVLAMAVAGDPVNANAIWNHLNGGRNLSELIAYENIRTVNRQLFGGASYVFLTKDRRTLLVCGQERKKKIKIEVHEGVYVRGAPRTYVTHLNLLLGDRPLNALEALAVSIQQSEFVSEEFDYYSSHTGEVNKNQKFTPKQMERLLAQVHSRLRLPTVKAPIVYNNHAME